VRLRLPVLLAARLRQVGRLVLRPDDDLLLALRQEEAGDVDGERRVSALVARDRQAVDPDRRGVVDGAEAQEQPVPVRQRRRLEGAAIPARAIEAALADAARRRLRRERHADLRLPRDVSGYAPACFGVEREVPDAVQADPIRAPQLGTRVALFAHSNLSVVEGREEIKAQSRESAYSSRHTC